MLRYTLSKAFRTEAFRRVTGCRLSCSTTHNILLEKRTHRFHPNHPEQHLPQFKNYYKPTAFCLPISLMLLPERTHTRIMSYRKKSSNSWQKAPVFSHFSLAFSTFAVLLRKGSQILKTYRSWTEEVVTYNTLHLIIFPFSKLSKFFRFFFSKFVVISSST